MVVVVVVLRVFNVLAESFFIAISLETQPRRSFGELDEN